MRKSTILKFAGVGAVLCATSLSASAALVSTTPAQGSTVTPQEMNPLIVQVDDLINMLSTNSYVKNAMLDGCFLTDGNGTRIKVVNFTACKAGGGLAPMDSSKELLENTEANRNKIALDFGVLPAGTYTLTFPASVYVASGLYMPNNVEFTAGPWTVEAGTVAPNPFEDGYTLSPNSNTTVVSLQSFHVTFDSKFVDGDFLGVQAENPAITLTKEGVAVETGAVTVTEDTDGRGFTVAFANEITEPGAYSLNIPEGVFTSVEGDYKTPEVTAAYTIKESPFKSYTLSPADGSDATVSTEGSLTFNVTFTDLGDAVLGGRVLGWDTPTLSDGTNTYNCGGGSAMTDGFQLTFSGLAEMPDGTYTLTIPAGFWAATDGRLTSEIVAEYNIINPTVGVAGIKAENGVVDVYDLAGRKVLSGADAAAVRDLDGGLYIVNGKKVVVRK